MLEQVYQNKQVELPLMLLLSQLNLKTKPSNASKGGKIHQTAAP
jgi:hypothetical protein